MERLPPFDSLVAFEAVFRLGSMTAAAGELCLTQGAISHRIRRLEEFLGAKVFNRGGSSVELTAAGMALSQELSDIIHRVESLREKALAASSPSTLRVGIGSALADYWLVKRLLRFTDRHPEIEIELLVLENEAPETQRDLDIRILWTTSSQAYASPTQQPLFREHVFPVCSPCLLPPGFKTGDPQILATLPLLEKRLPGSNSGMEWSWKAWFDQLGLESLRTAGIRFTSIGSVIAATLQGTGVGLARSMLVCDAIAEGKLVRVLTPEQDRLSSKVHIVKWSNELSDSSSVKTFVRWLCEEARSTETYIDPERRTGLSEPVVYAKAPSA